MNIAELSIRKSVITWVMTILMVAAGWVSFNGLSRLEDPEFTIKQAAIITPYPGASAAEVEEEVTNVIEKACQQLGQLWWIESRSSRGQSIVYTFIKDKYDKDLLPQVWDELRRKVGDAQRLLPPGAGPSIVNDDFGDVFGIYVALTGEGYSYKEIYDYAKFLQRELLTVQDVKKIVLYGNQPEAIYVEMRREKMAELGISPQDIYNSLASKNLPAAAGNLTLGSEYIAVNPTGEFTSEQQFGELLISSQQLRSDQLVYLKDVAEIRRDYREPASTILRYDGQPAIGLAISTVQGGNVVTMGEALGERFRQLEPMAPLGIDVNIISLQSETVRVAINGFLINLLEAILIVVVVLLIFMGLRSGLIIGAVLFVTIMGTFIFMGMKGVTLERISLGALIIALGMLVDNAIVVTDGMRMRMKQGEDALAAAKAVVAQTAVPLLGATVVAITAFASIGTSQDSTGEYCRSLFTVILISLMLSWLTAVTCTPLLCKTFLKKGKKLKEGEKAEDPYSGMIYRGYRSFLSTSIRHRWVTVIVVLGLFAAAMVGFGSVKKSFFPDSTRPQFFVDLWFPEGTHIDETVRQAAVAEEEARAMEGVEHVTTFVGGSQVRFLLVYPTEMPSSAFAQLLFDVDDYKKVPSMIPEMQRRLEEKIPGALVNVRQFVNGPATGGKIQLRLYGPDADELRLLAARADELFRAEPNIKVRRNEWGNKVKVVRPQMAEAQARRAGVTRPLLAQAIEAAVEGTVVGVYREEDELLPIIARSPEQERIDMDSLSTIQVWSPAAKRMISAGQVVRSFETVFENPHIWRYDRNKMIRYHIDLYKGLPADMLVRLKPEMERVLNVDVGAVLGKKFATGEDPFAGHTAATLPLVKNVKWPLKDKPGYFMSWGGEAEDSAKASAALGSTLPIFLGLMVLIVVFLFNSLKKTAIIWLCVPLAIIGVTAGLLLFNQPFGFMSLLGLLSLSGMLIKNAIVLIDQIDLEIASGKPGFQAIVDSGVSRLIPVMMAAITTILGMVPLLTDAFFIAMAVTIMFGLGFASVLTLIVVPVLYAIFFKIRAA